MRRAHRAISVEDLWPGDVIMTENGWRRILEIRPLGRLFDTLIVLQEPEGSWLASIGHTPTSMVVCSQTDEVEVHR